MNKRQEPRLRFQGFTGAWEEKKLGEVVQRITRKNTNLDSLLPLTISAQNGLIAQTEFFDNQVAGKNLTGYYLIENGEFAYNKSYSNGYPWGAIKRLNRHKNGVLSTLYILFKPTFASSQYLVSYFDGTNWHGEVASIAGEGARNHGLLNIPVYDFFEIKILLPCSLQEQSTIGNFFHRLDSQITESRAVLEKSRQLKKAMLAKMFPANGEKIPKIRFKGFEGEWESRKLGEVVEIVGGYAFKSAEFGSGNMAIIRISNILPNGSIGGDFVYFGEDENLEKFKANKNDYLIAMSGATTGKIGQVRHEAYINQRVGLFRQNENSNNDFIGSLLQKEEFLTYLMENWGAGAQPNISIKQMENYNTYFPNLKEQTAIGLFFRQLDETIALQSAEVEKLNQLKKGLLAAMLV